MRASLVAARPERDWERAPPGRRVASRGVGRARQGMRRAAIGRCLACAGAIAAFAAAPAAASSLASVPSGARPGPDILYAPAVDAPQLQNTGPRRAPPVLASGAEAYRAHEFLYQDSLYDDHGADETEDPNDPFSEAEQRS